MEMTFEEVDKFSDDIKPGDEFKIGGTLVRVEKVRKNNYDGLVFDLTIIGARFKKRSKMMLILPKKHPITTLK